MTEIAKQAGVSVPTVSRLLKGDKTLRISRETQDQILAIKERLGGVERRGARREIMTYNIAAPVNRVFSADWLQTNFMKSPFMANLERYLGDNKFLLNFNFFDVNEQFSFFEKLVGSSLYCDGLLLLTGIVDEPLARLLLENQFPHVSYDPGAEQFRVNTVCPHELDGIRQIVRHLRKLGHRRIGYLGPKLFRYPFFVTVMTEEGLDEDMFTHFTPSFNPINGQESWQAIGRESFSQYLQDPNREVTAFVCHNDWMTFGAIEAMRERGLVAGKDLSLAGYDDIESELASRFPHPILTTVATPWDQIGRRCGELLLNQIVHKQTQIVHERLPVSLVVRGTTGPCRTR